MARPRKYPIDSNNLDAKDEVVSGDTQVTAPATEVVKVDCVLPPGMSLGLIQFPRDASPWPASYRIQQTYNDQKSLRCWVSESAYEKNEAKSWFDKLLRDSMAESMAKKGSPWLLPIKSKIHWVRFELDFIHNDIKKERINPETDLPENAQ